MGQQKLFMVLLGCTPPGRNTEQHDIFFSIGNGLKDIVQGIIDFWPEASGKVHIDAWREVSHVDGYTITVMERTGKPGTINPGKTAEPSADKDALFFINLGGYKENEFEEFHYKMLFVADSVDAAKAKAKKAIFFKQASLEDGPTSRVATAHIDDKYGIDVDDVFKIQDILPDRFKEKYEIRIGEPEEAGGGGKPDDYHLGYLQLVHI